MSEHAQPLPPGALLRWGSWFYLALAIGAIVWLGVRGGAIELSVFLDSDSWHADLAAGIGAGFALAGLWILGRVTLPSARRLERDIARMVGPLTLAEAVILAALSGFSEELFFRGAVQSEWGIVPATLVFALLHLGPGRQYRLWTLFALVAGTGLGALVLWRGNLLAAIVAHVTVNVVGLSRLRKLAPGASEG